MAALRVKHTPNINLLPKTEFESSVSGRVVKWVLTTFRIIVIAVEFVVICGFLSRFWLDLQNSEISDEISQKERLVLSNNEFEKDFRNVQKRLEIFTFASSSGNTSSKSLNDITRLLPNDVVLLSLTKTGNLIDISAQSLSERSIQQFITNIKSTGVSGNVEVGQIESKADSSYITFNLLINI